MTDVAPICFVHIPKTAGGTLKSVLAGAFGKPTDAGNFLLGPEPALAKVARLGQRPPPLVIGHVPYSSFRLRLPRETRYIAMLREPVDRVLSHYHRHLATRRKMGPLADVLDAALADVCNLATRFLCDRPLDLCEAPTAADLADTKRNLGQFAFVGLQERFDESVILLHRALGIERLSHYGEWRHVNKNRPPLDEISAAERQRIVERNALDIELYDYARELVQKRLREAGELAAELDQLRRACSDARLDFEQSRHDAGEWLRRNLPAGRTIALAALLAEAEADGVARRPLKQELNARRRAGTILAGTIDGDGRLAAVDGMAKMKSLEDAVFLQAL